MSTFLDFEMVIVVMFKLSSFVAEFEIIRNLHKYVSTFSSASETPGLNWDPFRGLAISGEKGPMDPHGRVTARFLRGVRIHDRPCNVFEF